MDVDVARVSCLRYDKVGLRSGRAGCLGSGFKIDHELCHAIFLHVTEIPQRGANEVDGRIA